MTAPTPAPSTPIQPTMDPHTPMALAIAGLVVVVTVIFVIRRRARAAADAEEHGPTQPR
jgi:heme/copper-type cytochrome/quinol oxidase subunit 2